jgi:hypothetical protein
MERNSIYFSELIGKKERCRGENIEENKILCTERAKVTKYMDIERKTKGEK